MKVWVLAPYGHRLTIWGVFSSAEKAIESVRESEDVDEDDEFWELPDEIHLEEFELDG